MKKYFSALLFCMAVFCLTGCSYTLNLLNYGDDLQKLRVAAKNQSDLNQSVGNERVTAVMGFVVLGKPEAAKVLVEAGANLNAQDRFGRTPLVYAITKDYDDLAKAMIDRKPKLDIRDNDNGMSALWYAINNKNLKVTKWLAEAGADINLLNKEGDAPLAFTLEIGDMPIFYYLLSHKTIKPDITAKDGRTTLMFAAQKNNIEAIAALVKAGANPKAVDKNNTNALMRAASADAKQAVAALLKLGLNVNAKDKKGISALLYSIASKDPEITGILIDAGADLNVQMEDGSTALIGALVMKNKETARMLMKKGADVNIKNKKGQTALQAAQDMGLNDIADELRKIGAK
jgi:uncharacterized protein